MGDMADYYIGLGQAQGWSPFGRGRFGPKASGHDVTCSRCGTPRLKWRETEHGWRLFSEERGDLNEKLQHQCSAAAGSDFEALE